MHLRPVLCGAVRMVGLGVWRNVVRVAVLLRRRGMAALLDMVWLHVMVLRRIAQD